MLVYRSSKISQNEMSAADQFRGQRWGILFVLLESWSSGLSGMLLEWLGLESRSKVVE